MDINHSSSTALGFLCCSGIFGVLVVVQKINRFATDHIKEQVRLKNQLPLERDPTRFVPRARDLQQSVLRTGKLVIRNSGELCLS